MFIQTFLIAGGNSTALVAKCPDSQRPGTLSSLMDQVEQIGFIDQKDVPRIHMMGGEFCINATLAFASTLGPSGTLVASGVVHAVAFANHDGQTAIQLPLVWHKHDNIIVLEGIGFVLREKHGADLPEKEELAALCRQYDLPAFGAILFDNNAITPYVHVAGVDSFVAETACGSGSVALHLFTGARRIKQPTGQYITVEHDREFHISAQVTTMDRANICSGILHPEPLAFPDENS